MSSQAEIQAKQLRVALEKDSYSEAEILFKDGLTDDASSYIAAIRRSGAFRSSNYSFKTKCPFDLVHLALGKNLPPEIHNYLTSIEALYYLAKRELRQIYKGFISGLNTQSFKSYLAAIDNLFWWPEIEVHYHSLRRGYKGFAMEELATAFSYHFFHMSEKHRIDNINLNVVYEDKVVNKYYLDKLASVALIERFREAEVLVDVFNYEATRAGKTVTIKSPTPRLEQSIRLGYIHFEQQMMADRERFSKKELALPFKSLIDLLHDKLADIVFVEIKDPIHRITMRLPALQYIKDTIATDKIFQEEIVQLQSIQKELLIDAEKILEVPIADSLTIFDIVKFQRFFRLLYESFKKYAEARKIDKNPLFYRSMIPVYPAKTLQDYLAILFGDDKARQILHLFTWDKNSDSIFDVQTQPIIACGDRFVVPIGILSESNLVRNILVRNRFRFDSNSDIDPVGDLLWATLSPVSSGVQRNITYQYQGMKGEVDVLAAVGRHVFAFECKNSIHPCSPFELRTIYDYILKAAKQLTQFKTLIQEQTFREYLNTKTGLAITEQAIFHTCIVTGNRMFSGWIEGGHPVRPLHELCTIVSLGKIFVHAKTFDNQMGSDYMECSVWRGNKFAPEDLVEYIEGDSLHKPRFDSMVEWAETFDINSDKLVFSTYLVDPAKAIEAYMNSFECRIVQDERNE